MAVVQEKELLCKEFLSRPKQLLIDGKWVNSVSGKTFETLNPATEEVLCRVAEGGKEDVDKAVKAARRAFETGPWRKMSTAERARIMLRLADLIEKHADELAQIETLDNGKPINESRYVDVPQTVETFRYYAGWATKLEGETINANTNFFTYTLREPVGVVGQIIPWNFPMLMLAWKWGPALAAGNCVVLKPAEQTPLSALRIGELALEAGFPDGVINIITGFGADSAGEAISHHMDIDKVAFTGEDKTGKLIVQASTSNLKRVSLELGGKNAQIVMNDADQELALEAVLWGAFGTTGQRCTATSRLILHKDIHDEFLAKLIDRTNKLRLGYGNENKVDVGPCVSESQRASVNDYVLIGKNEDKATLVTGGDFATEGDLAKGWFYKPTIFADVKPGMRIEQEEIFGPVLSVIKCEDFEDGINILNGTKYGLSSSVFTKNVNDACRAIRDIKAGITYINGATIGAEAHMPFGGVKQTGNGHREGGWTVYDFYSEWKAVYIDYSGKLQRAQIDNY